MSYDAENIAQQVANMVASALRNEIAEQVARMSEQHAQTLAAVRNEAEQANQRTASQFAENMADVRREIAATMQQSSDEVRDRFIEGARKISDAGSSQITASAESVRASVATEFERLARQVATLQQATARNEAEAVKLATERAALEDARAKAEAAELKARRTMQLLQLETDAEIAHAAAMAAHSRVQKETLRRMDAEASEMTERHELAMDVIRRGLDEIYPQLSEAKDKAAEAAMQSKDDEDGDA